MFNDERINTECGKIYRGGILLAVAVTLLSVLAKSMVMLAKGSFFLPITYTEGAILLLGILIVGFDLIRFRGAGDERVAYERHNFYRAAGKIFVLCVFGIYILTIPFLKQEMLGGQAPNQLLILLEVLGLLYVLYCFKSKQIYVNYSFIDEPGGQYYRRVLKYIGYLFAGLFFPFLMAALWEILLHGSYRGALVILIAYLSSAIGLSLEYFFLSWVEKASYESAEGSGLPLGARIAMLVAFAVSLCFCALECVYVHLATGDLSAMQDVGATLGRISQQKSQLAFLVYATTGLAVCQVLATLRNGMLLHAAGRIKLLLLALSAVWATFLPILYQAFSQELLRFWVNRVDPILASISFLISLALWVLTVRGLIRERGGSRWLWSIPALQTIAVGVRLFLISQSMVRAATYLMQAIALFSSLLLITVLWRYRASSTPTTDETVYN